MDSSKKELFQMVIPTIMEFFLILFKKPILIQKPQDRLQSMLKRIQTNGETDGLLTLDQ